MSVHCSFCQKRGHNIVSCKRFKEVQERMEVKLTSLILGEYRWDVIAQTRTTVEHMKAEVEFLKAENENLSADNARLWAWIETWEKEQREKIA